MGIPAERVFVAPNAATLAPTSEPPGHPTSNRLSILFVGRLQARKRLDLLLRVCASLPDAQKPDLTIVGDGPEMEHLRQLAQEVYPQTEFTGTKMGPELEPYFQRANLFVLPGTGGLAVQQAMAFALPVVVAEGDGTQSSLVTPKNGWQLIPGSFTSLREVLIFASNHLPDLRGMGLESYRIVKEDINIERMVSVFVTAMQKVTLR